MSALIATEIAPGYGMITVTLDALEAEGDTGLKNGEKWSLKNLLDFSLITSSNDGIRAVALALGALDHSDVSKEEILHSFVSEMNRKAVELDLKDTYFYNETGLDESEIKGGAYGTSRDVAMLFKYIITKHPDLIEATKVSSTTIMSLDENAHVARNTNILVGEIPGFLGSKTGYTNTAGGNLVFAFEPESERPIIVSILGSTEQGRFNDARALIRAVEDYLNEH
jgi:serine-type D-Ala-D-Ala carboxypeptidase (penicillin-binding protein 5/6)